MLCRTLIALSYVMLALGCGPGAGGGTGAAPLAPEPGATNSGGASFGVSPRTAPGRGGRPAGAGTSAGLPALRYPRGPRPWLGVEMEAGPSAEAGVQVVRVLRGSPAAKAGLLPGDVVLRLGDTPVLSPPDLAELVDRASPGVETALSFRREDQTLLRRVALEGKPEFEDRLRLAFVGLQAPSIDGVITFQGEAATLRELHGRVVLLEFWASWCGICRYLAPTLNRLERQHRPAGLTVLGITLDPPERGRAAAVRTKSMDYALASDSGGRITRRYLASQVPTVFVIDPKGVVVDVMVGVAEDRVQELVGLVEELLRASRL